MDLIKLIWDFKGQDAQKIAEHHQIHLNQFVNSEKLDFKIIGVDFKSELHSIAFLVVEKKDMITLRDALKPHRGEVYLDKM